jgi:hypothetical protein
VDLRNRKLLWFYLLTILANYYQSDQIKEDTMGRGGGCQINAYGLLMGKPEGKRRSGKRRHIVGRNISIKKIL